jgi:hypothetical protein
VEHNLYDNEAKMEDEQQTQKTEVGNFAASAFVPCHVVSTRHWPIK